MYPIFNLTDSVVAQNDLISIIVSESMFVLLSIKITTLVVP